MQPNTRPGLIDPRDLQHDFITPQLLGGRVVEWPYSQTEQYVIKLTHDRSSNTLRYVAYDRVDDDDGADPWNSPPATGAMIGPVLLARSWTEVSDDDLADFLAALLDHGESPNEIQGLDERIADGGGSS